MNTVCDSQVIQLATAADAASLAELGATTFVEAFGHLYPPADLKTFLQQAHTIEKWRATLTDPDIATWVAASADGEKLGYIIVGPCKLPVADLEPRAGEIQQLYVLARFHKMKLGTRLIETGLNWLHSQARSPLYVGVWSENYGAQRLYARHGFKHVGAYGFRVGSTVDHEFIFKRRV